MRVCNKCNRPLVIFRGFWQCKYCIEEKEKASKKELLAYESKHGIMTKRTRKVLKREENEGKD